MTVLIDSIAVRVRPPLQPTDPGYDLIPQRFRESTCEVSTPTSLSVQSPQGKKLFVFDQVFEEDTTQDGVWEYLSDSVSSFVKGYNVSILAYGQSGSGKSYTMGTSGPEDQADPKIMGVVPRAAQALFEKLNGPPLRQSGLQTPKRYSTQALPTLSSFARATNGATERNWTLKATYVEIYQEQLRDLLVPEHVPQQDRAQVAIREDPSGRIMVTGLTQVAINSAEDLLNALNFGSSIRQTDATNINARSSRSHAVFSLNLVQKTTDGQTTPRQEKRMSVPVEAVSGAENIITIDSKLHFVDLAGSERLKNTGATGDRAKEGISINAGLASLGKVISQLSSKHANAHISYRDSRLTRLLQDSLGGNAITFMVACVTPAVFHLSETLNTVHYAQRARAIQSKPEIQQSREDGDKQAAIDRLRAEVSFLRDQIRHSEHAESKGIDTRGRSEKLRGKEAELQTQLMDMQENYNALSNRHAKLISELSKARDGDTDTPLLKDAVGANAMERVKRSSSFAEAVEQMVLEYEKTIQTLESSLSKTRSTLSNSESTLLEKETRIAYMETIQQQLQARIQKAIDREQNNESYLHDLEVQIEGTASGEEQNAALINELRRELARVKESESSGEDYISTLEERLAEAEQDQEIMQRELDRLEHVVERQRSIGRLDNLLGELDSIRQHDPLAPAPSARDMNGHAPKTNGHRDSYDPFRSRSRSSSSAGGRHDEGFEDAETELVNGDSADYGQHDHTATRDAMQTSAALAQAHAATQNDFMADKLENLTQELFDLKGEHESVMTDYDKLQQKYQTALETLAKLEYDKETPRAPHAPGRVSSFLADAGMKGEDNAGAEGQPSSSRSFSAELSSQQRVSSSLDQLEAKTDGTDMSGEQRELAEEVQAKVELDPAQVPLPEEDEREVEVDMLRRLYAEKESSLSKLTKNYRSLSSQHKSNLAQIDELKQELQRAQNLRPSSPSYSKSYFSRKSTYNEMATSNSDRATRAITSLKSIANDNLEENPEKRHSFQLNIDTVMTELHTRSDRVQALEAELATAKTEIGNKQTMIAGLTRERSSLKASLGVDFSVVSQMRDQLMESENQIRALHEQHATRERELKGEMDNLKTSLSSHANQLPTPREDKFSEMPGSFLETPAVEVGERQAMAGASQQRESEDVARLQRELASWETRHHDAMESMKASESKLLGTIADLEQSMHKAQDGQQGRSISSEPSSAEARVAESLEQERAKHQEVVDALQRDLEQYRSTANSHVDKLQQLENSYTSILQQVEEETKSRDLSERELKTHRDLVANLENQLQVHKSAITIHQESLESLQSSHSRELDDLKISSAAAEKDAIDRYGALENQHKQVTEDLQRELVNSQNEKSGLLRNASAALGYETDASKLHSQIKGLVEEGKELHNRHLKTTNELKAVQEELQRALNNTVEMENKMGELKMKNEEANLNLKKMTDRENKSSRLVEELEEQLSNNFDSHRATTNRLSSMQGEVAQQRIELERELESQKLKCYMLEVSLADNWFGSKILTALSNKLRPSSEIQHNQTEETSIANRSLRKQQPMLSRDQVPDPRYSKPENLLDQPLCQHRLLPFHFHPCPVRQAQAQQAVCSTASTREQRRPHFSVRLLLYQTPRHQALAMSLARVCRSKSKNKKLASAPSKSTSTPRSSLLRLSRKRLSTLRPAPTGRNLRWSNGVRNARRWRTRSMVCVRSAPTLGQACRRLRRRER